MRTRPVWLAMVLATRAFAEDTLAERFEPGVGAEVTLVGLTFGARPEVLFRVGERGTVSRLRLAVGVFGGPEQLFVPTSFGYRAVFRQESVVQPTVGAGVEFQQRFVAYSAPVRAFGGYLEGGVGFSPTPGVSIGAMLSVDVMFLGMPGFGFGPRVFASWRLP